MWSNGSRTVPSGSAEYAAAYPYISMSSTSSGSVPITRPFTSSRNAWYEPSYRSRSVRTMPGKFGARLDSNRASPAWVASAPNTSGRSIGVIMAP